MMFMGIEKHYRSSSISLAMIYKALQALVLLGCSVGSGSAATPVVPKLIREQVGAYRKILGASDDRLTLESFMTLMRMHDEDFTCDVTCLRTLREMLGKDAVEFSRLEELLTTIYGDAISDDPFQPQEVHLAVTDDPTEMKVIWATMKGLVEPFVEYSLASSSEWSPLTTKKVDASKYTYDSPQYWYPTFSGMLYEADMTGLKPGKIAYKYRVGGVDALNRTVRRSKDFVFHSSPSTSAPDQTNTLAMLGDQSTFALLGFTTSNLLAQIQDKEGVDMVLYAGDLCYAGLGGDLTPLNGLDIDDEFGHIWDLWAIQNEPIAATRPFMTTPGNHDAFYNYTAFKNRYKMPFKKSQGNFNHWFSFDYGNVHVVSIDTEFCVTPECPQLAWIKEDLARAAANRDNVPWIVVSMHRATYSSNADAYSDHSPGGRFQTNLEPLFLQHDVDFVLQGHLHAYERVHPLNKGEVTVFPTDFTDENGATVPLYKAAGKGPVYVVQGNTGAMQVEHWVMPKPEWSGKRFANGIIPPDDEASVSLRNKIHAAGSRTYTDTFGIGLATFVNSTHLHYRAVPVSGTIGTDEFWVVKRA